jgi:lysophospholipase L1-like esterase
VKPGFAYLNLGRRGLRLAEIRDTQLAPALDFEPDLAIVAGGGNDAIHPSFEETTLRRGLEELIVPFRERGVTVLTVGLFDLARSGLLDEPYASRLAERFDVVERVTAQMAESHGCLHSEGHHHPRAADPGIFASDLMHCNARGHAIAEANIVRALADAARG